MSSHPSWALFLINFSFQRILLITTLSLLDSVLGGGMGGGVGLFFSSSTDTPHKQKEKNPLASKIICYQNGAEGHMRSGLQVV